MQHSICNCPAIILAINSRGAKLSIVLMPEGPSSTGMRLESWHYIELGHFCAK